MPARAESVSLANAPVPAAPRRCGGATSGGCCAYTRAAQGQRRPSCPSGCSWQAHEPSSERCSLCCVLQPRHTNAVSRLRKHPPWYAWPSAASLAQSLYPCPSAASLARHCVPGPPCCLTIVLPAHHCISGPPLYLWPGTYFQPTIACLAQPSYPWPATMFLAQGPVLKAPPPLAHGMGQYAGTCPLTHSMTMGQSHQGPLRLPQYAPAQCPGLTGMCSLSDLDHPPTHELPEAPEEMHRAPLGARLDNHQAWDQSGVQGQDDTRWCCCSS